MSAQNRINELLLRYPRLAVCENEINECFELLKQTYSSEGKLLLCGNGGSAADAEHISGELLKGFCCKRPLGNEMKEKLPAEIADKLQAGLPAIPLTSFISLSTAFLNDVDASLIYAQLVLSLGKDGDSILGISTSGNADNVCKAFEVAKANGLNTIALTGLSGGKLASMAQVAIRVPESETFKVQELHLPVYHTLCLMLEDEFFG